MASIGDPFSRRRALAGAVAAGGLLAARRLLPGGGRAAAQSSGTPSAAPAASSTSDAPPQTERAGRGGALEVVRDQEPRYTTAQKQGGKVTLVRPSVNPLSFNPVAMEPDPQVVLSYLEPLLRPDPVTMEPQPWLATGWRWSDDNRSLAVDLRTDVTWQDGTPLTSADVVFSLLAYRDDPSSVVANVFSSVADVTAAGDQTVEITLSEIDGNFPFNALSQPIFQRAQFEAVAGSDGGGLSQVDWSGWTPIGTGPWRVDGFDEAEVRFAPYDGYWGDGPYLDAMTVTWVDGEANRSTAWREREADILWPVRGTDIRALGARPGRLYAADTASVLFAAFNFSHPDSLLPDLFADLNVRRALSLAVDRERYADEVFGGFANVAATGTVAQPWAHDVNLKNPRHDPDQAAALLAAAGWVDYNGDGILENSVGVPFIIKVILRSDARPDLARVLARVKDDLLQVGVVLNIAPVDPEAMQTAITSTRDFDLIAYAFDLYPGFTDWDLYGSAWNIERNPLGWNPGAYSNPDADAAISAFLSSVTIDDQRGALAQLQQAVDDDLFGLWFGFPQSLIVVNADLDGFQPDKVWQTALTQYLWRPDRPKPPTPTPTATPSPTATAVPTQTPSPTVSAQPTAAASAVPTTAGAADPTIAETSDEPAVSDAPASGTPSPTANPGAGTLSNLP